MSSLKKKGRRNCPRPSTHRFSIQLKNFRTRTAGHRAAAAAAALIAIAEKTRNILVIISNPTQCDSGTARHLNGEWYGKEGLMSRTKCPTPDNALDDAAPEV